MADRSRKPKIDQRSGERIADRYFAASALIPDAGCSTTPRVMNNRQIHHANQHQDTCRTPARRRSSKACHRAMTPTYRKAAPVQKSDVHPIPTRCPTSVSPCRAGNQGNKGKHGTNGGIAATARLAIFICQTRPINAAPPLMHKCPSTRSPQAHAGRYAVAISLLIISRSKAESPDPPTVSTTTLAIASHGINQPQIDTAVVGSPVDAVFST